jgi:methionine synthase II (cobalamin-independent)/MFS family permease
MSLIRRDRDFRLFWIGETTSRVGSNVTTVVVPLVAVTVLHSGAFTASALTAAAWLPWLVFGLGAGPVVDRSRKRRLMIICDVISAALFASVPIAGALGLLSAGQLLIVAFGAGCVSVLFTTAYSAFLIDLVPGPADRAAANSTLQGSASAAQVGGPGIGGLLATALGAVTALLADSASFVISAICLLTIRSPDADGPTTARRPLRAQVADGVRFLSRDRLLRPLVLFGGTANLALMGYQALMVVFLVRVVGLHAGTVGLVMGLVSCGGVIGAFAGNALARWLGSGRALLLTKIGACPFALLIPLAARGWREAFVVLGGVGVGVGIVAGNVISSGFMQAYTPQELFARSNATINVFNYGTMPLGALLGGLLATELGVRDAMWATTGLLPLTALFIVLSPLRRLRSLPTQPSISSYRNEARADRREGARMQTSTDHILTTHTGSLPRPAWLQGDAPDPEVARAVTEVVSRQRAAGIDVVSDGEMGKASYATYVTGRLSGFGEADDAPFLGRGRSDLADFPGYAQRLSQQLSGGLLDERPVCVGDVRYTGRAALDAELEHLGRATEGSDADVFCTAASPGVIARFLPNRHYPSETAYLSALADAMKEEYDAIAAAGFILQLDCPDITAGWHARTGDLTAHRAMVAERLALLDHATRDVPADRMRLHLCWGNYEGPHHHDLPLEAIIDLVLDARPDGVSFEGANPRHDHEWAIFADRDLPGGTVLIPGVVDSTTNFIEHPELIAQRIGRYADVAGRERVLASTDCGFATAADITVVDPDIAWAKLAALSEGARLASERLWNRSRV